MSEQEEFSRENSSSSQDYEHDLAIDNILVDEKWKLHRSLGKRFSHLNSITLTPRINGRIPDISNATLNYERFSERLAAYGLAELQVEGDGNCQFRALADQLFRSPNYHRHVRKEVVKQLQHFQELYEGYVPMCYKAYLKDMKRSGEWGDHVTLQAAADRFTAKICLLTSFRNNCLIEIVPMDKAPLKELWLSFWSEVHYNSLYETDDLPSRITKRKHWPF